MLRFAATSSVATAAVSARAYSSYQKPLTGSNLRDAMVSRCENIPLNQLRYDHLGPRTGTHIRFNLMSESQKTKSGIRSTDDMTGRRTGETPLRWVEDPNNWVELNKADWEDMKKNDNKLWIMPRLSQ